MGSSKIAEVTGTVTTTIAGILLGALSLSAFGAAPTLFGFLVLLVLATVIHRVIARNR